MATTVGSLTTTPLFFKNTNVLAVPKSIPKSCAPNIFMFFLLFYVFLSDLSFKMHVYLYYAFIPMSFLHKPNFQNLCFVHQKITNEPFLYDKQKNMNLLY